MIPTEVYELAVAMANEFDGKMCDHGDPSPEPYYKAASRIIEDLKKAGIELVIK